jgi:hypothetical protein
MRPKREQPPERAQGGKLNKNQLRGGIFGTESSTPAAREAVDRVHAVRVVLDAVDEGVWPLELGIVDGAVALLEAASRWQLLAELEAVG